MSCPLAGQIPLLFVAEYLKMTPRPMSAAVVGDIFKGETSGESEDEFFKKKGKVVVFRHYVVIIN